MEELLTPTAPGWYPDPFARHPFRYFDGTAWTGYAGTAASVQWDEAPLAEPEEPRLAMPGIVTALLGFALGVAASFALGRVLTSSEEDRAGEIVLGSLVLWTPLIVACVLVSRRRGSGNPLRDYAFRFRWIDIGFGLAGSLVGRVMAGVSVAPIPFPTRNLNDTDRAIFGESISGTWTWVALVLVTCVGAPLIEELFFRGLVQARLVGRFGPTIGIVVASLLFGAAHLIGWQGPESLAYAWAISFGGLVLGLIFHMTRRLGPSILAHAFFNVQAMIALAVFG